MRVELKDFSGGITDFIYTDDMACFEQLDNIVITKDKCAESRPGTRVISGFSARPSVSIDIPQEMIEFNKQKFFIYGGEILRYDNGVWEKLTAFNPTIKPLTNSSTDSAYSYFTFNKHLLITDSSGSKTVKVFKDNLGAYKVATAGLPKFSGFPTVSPVSNNNKSYLYTFIYSYTYNVDGDTFIDKSTPVTVQVVDASDFLSSGNLITNISPLINTSLTHYDVNNIKVEIYRTIDTGTTSYLVQTLSNGTTSFTDTMTDDVALQQAVLYTDGGISDNDEPPVASQIEISNSCGYYGNVANNPYRLYQSQIGDIDSVPASYYLDFEEEIQKIIAHNSNVIVFTENQLWRVEGTIELDGAGSQRKVMFEDKVGYIGGATRADGGIYFAGYDSFYFTDGYSVRKIPSQDKNIPQRFKTFRDQEAPIAVAYDRSNQHILWAVKNSISNYQIYVYDISFNAITSWSGNDGSFSTISLLATRSGELYRGDSSGYIFEFSSQHYDDPIIDIAKPYTDWSNSPIVYNLKHIAFDFGYSDINKWVTKVTMSGNGQTNLDLQINSFDDSSVLPKPLVPISHSSGLIWGDELWMWSVHDDVWGLEKRFVQTRHFRSGKIRCKRKQLQATNAIVNIAQSYTDMPNSRVIVNSALKMATVLDPGLVYIPDDCVGDTIYINNTAFIITDSGADTFKLRDDSAQLVDGVFDWHIKGYQQRQRLHVSSIIYTYEMLDDRGGYYSAQSEANA